MLLLLTDFGLQGPYVGQLKVALQQQASAVPVVDLMHDLPSFQIEYASYLLPALLRDLPSATVCLCVVDPGVGGARRAVVLKVDGLWLVGPDNGLFDRMAAGADQLEWFEIDWRPESLSSSFHGRDLFAPVAAAITRGEQQSYLKPCAGSPLCWTEPSLSKVIYIDGYGNCMTGILAKELAKDSTLEVAGCKVAFAETFCQVMAGELFWYENSLGFVEIAANQANAQQKLGASIGSVVTKV